MHKEQLQSGHSDRLQVDVIEVEEGLSFQREKTLVFIRHTQVAVQIGRLYTRVAV
jgi:hypothetical protein